MHDRGIRSTVQDDLEVLWDFLAMAAYEPDADAAKAIPRVAKYLVWLAATGGFRVHRRTKRRDRRCGLGTALFPRRAQVPLRGRRGSEGVDQRETECPRPRRWREAYARVDRRGRLPWAWPLSQRAGRKSRPSPLRAPRLFRHPRFCYQEPRWRNVDRHGTETLILILSIGR